ncbi:hypothetical protein HN854_05350 [Candidatus Peregrinibacteria bacterium]|jgi:hypothetical protein|nr:hypothetical protein [Candidatus Peregrinibacteria bacterium]MBT7345420.1 hypothetical protein [Candidatus Peregrinibacteria bacterium]
MVKQTSENSADYVSTDPRVDKAVTDVEKQVLKDIASVSVPVRESMYSVLLKESKLQHFDNDPTNRSAHERRASINASKRMSVSEELLAKEMEGKIKFPNIKFKEHKAELEFDIRNPYMMDEKRTESEIITELTKTPPTNGIIFLNGTTMPIGQAEQEAIAKKFLAEAKKHRELKSLRAVFGADGVSEFNIQTALMLAAKQPDPVLGALRSQKNELEDEAEKIKANLNISGHLDSLEKTKPRGFDMGMNMDELEDEVKNLADDIKTGGQTSQTVLGQNSRRINLLARHVELRKSFEYFTFVSNKLKAIYDNSNLIGVTSQALNDLVSANGVDKTKINIEMNIGELVQKIRTELALEDTAKYKQELKDNQEAVKKAEESALSGREAVLVTYQMYFENEKGLSASEARERARELYSRNAVGRKDMQVAQDSVDNPEVWNQPNTKIEDWTSQKGKELVEGRQETYVCNFAESPQIGIPKGRGTGKGLTFKDNKGTKRLWITYRKNNARPAWGRLQYPQLITAYYGLRTMVQNGTLNNTGYVRSQRDEIMRILVREHSRRLTEEFDIADIPEDVKKQADAEHQQKGFQKAVQLALSGDIPSAYQGAVSGAIEYSKKKTARKRRAIARATKWTTWTHGLKPLVKGGSWKDPAAWPVNTAKAGGKAVVGTAKGIYRILNAEI